MTFTFPPVRLVLAAAVAFAGVAVGFDTPPVDAAVQMNKAPVRMNEHLVASNKGATKVRLYHRFTNLGQVPADVVRFTVNLGRGNEPQTIVDTGTFAPGIGIDREHDLASYSSQIPPDCVVSYVHFTDGTSWTAPGFQ
jgi:hypothetical protein